MGDPQPASLQQPRPHPGRRLAVLPLVLAALGFLGCGEGGTVSVPDPGNHPRPALDRYPATPGPGEDVCRRFMALKNAGDPHADDLLAPRPQVPAEAVSQQEADRIDTELMLRQPLQVRDVRPLPARSPDVGRFALVVRGSLSSERLLVRTPDGVEASQRALWSPDLVVEVRDGKIHGVVPRLHED